MTIAIIQIIISVLLVAVILLQNKGTGLGAAFGGDGSVFRTKRGLEKTLHRATILLSILFFLISLAPFVL